MWLNTDGFIARRVGFGVQTRHHAVHPVADGPVSVMVERIHRHGLKTTVGPDPIPAFPDGGSAHGDRIKPGRIGFLIQKRVRQIIVTKTCQDMTEVRGTQESCGEVIAITLDVLRQVLGRLRALVFRQEIKLQGQHISRLGGRKRPPIGCHILVQIRRFDLFQQ